MDDYKSLLFACLAIGVYTYAVRWYTDPLRSIPTVGGSSLPGLSWIAAFRMLRNCRDVLEEGYRKYPERTFKIPGLGRWMVVVSGRELIEELRKRGEEELSAHEGGQDTIESKYIFEPSVLTDEYHVKVLQEKLTRKLPALLPDVMDEVRAAVDDHIVTREDEWSCVEVTPVMQNIIARVSSRIFVGLPLCRNEGYLTLVVNFAVDVMKTVVVLRLIPRFMKPIVALFYNMAKRDTERAVQFLRPIIEERQRSAAELGEAWNDKPTITHALTRLAEQPELLGPLRDEIEKSIVADGWTSAALANMWKLDSLLRETLRFHGISLLSMGRKAMKDLTLSDGTHIPRGTRVEVAAHPLHHDSAVLERADEFDAFRYARVRAGAAGQGQGARHQFTSTSPEYVPFGHGSHACPGRYFASTQLKAILAHLILNYDIRLGGDGVRAPDVFIAMGVLPSPQSRVLFRPRQRGESVNVTRQ